MSSQNEHYRGPSPAPDFYPVLWRLISSWTAVTILLSGIASLAVIGILGPNAAGFAAAAGTLCMFIVLFVAAGARALARLLSMPARTLATIAGQDGTANAAPPSLATLTAEFRRLDQTVLRSALEKQSRLSDLQRSRDAAQAERLSRADFFSGVSHELRTPLNAIIGYAMLLSEDMTGRGDSDAARDLDRILISSRRLLRLINDILDFSRLDAGIITVDRAVLDLRAVVDTVASEYGPGTTALHTFVSPAAAVIIGDESKIRQALLCLLGAAASERSGDLSLSADVDPAKNSHIRFTISGTGLNLTHLKGAQHQDAPVPQSAITAAGLAGSVVKRLATLLGGDLAVSEYAQTVALILPRNPGSDENALAPTLVQATSAVVLHRAGSSTRTVLVIDDDEATVDLLGRWLSDKGYTVVSAASGAEGLAKARSMRPDAIVLDIFMPGKSGYEVLTELQADPQLKSIPVIIVSSDDNRSLGLEAGAAEVMVKPLTPNRLGDVLQTLSMQIRGDILVVDDEADAGELVQRYGRMAGLKVRVAETVNKGLEEARAIRPDAIVLDLCFPGADGFVMLDALAADDALRDIPVMVLSQMDVSPDQHVKINQAGHLFQAKWKTSPLQIVENLKTLVAS